MNREKIAWMVSLVLIAMLAFQLPGTLARRDDEYAFVKTLIDLHRQIDSNYVDPVDQDKLQMGSINGMMGELDPYSIYVPPAKEKEFDNMLEGHFEGVGIELSQTESGDVQVVTPILDSPALKAGVRAGDIIVKVNGQDIKGKKIAEVQQIIKGPLHSAVKLTVRHLDGTEVELSMTREQINLPTVMGFRQYIDKHGAPAWDYWVSKDQKIAYIRLTQFTGDTFTELKAAMEQVLAQGMRGLILDLRFNPGGRLDQAKKVVNLYIRDGVIVSTRGLHRAPEVLRATPGEALATEEFPMIVLVNEHSASAAEIVSGSLKDNKRALIIGTRTYGKGSVQELIPMAEDGGLLKLTVAYYYLPNGELVHKKKGATQWGVEPQINVPLSAEAEQKVLLEQSDQEMLHVTTRPSTGPASTHPATAPATQPIVDTQLETALSTMVGSMILNHEYQISDIRTTQPTTAPAAR
jgi:carboxyl-terminal processing protease